ncbi:MULTISPECIES: transaldolase [Aestuariimicrobium]|uniref:transaldolase n=1 Tax=Aestuariimicrobium TaxID=396388 RepID=UPI0003B6E170|nr:MULTISPECIES: transaldolase [Aestuariimicrobium]CAI9399181.1 Transaldolase [Aestuariimicrobium sp. T2.26MG-19.2B]
MSQNPNTQALSDAGVSIWLDDLSRERLQSGNLAELVATRNVVGVTTNPTIFAAALADGEAYAEQVGQLRREGADVAHAIRELTTTDVRTASDLFADLYTSTDGYDGRVSIEVEPGLAHDTGGTIKQAAELHDLVNRDNVLIKIPATLEGLPAITETIAAGISVNVTLIFSAERYQQVIEAYLAGLEKAAAAGLDLSTIHSVASVFVSRIDSEVDKRLKALGTDEASALLSTVAVANTRVAHHLYAQAFTSQRWHALADQGAHVQRPLWASTGVKNPDLDDTFYVSHLVTSGVVNTMPEKTLQAFADHGRVAGDTVVPHYGEAEETLRRAAGVGLDMEDVFATLEREGVQKFSASWDELVASVQKTLDEA